MDVGGKGKGQAELAVDVVEVDVLLATLTEFAEVLSIVDGAF